MYIDLVDRYTYFGFFNKILVYDLEEFVEIPIKIILDDEGILNPTAALEH